MKKGSQYDKEMICPYCEWVQSDEDYRDNIMLWHCQNCEEEFEVEAEYERYFFTEERKTR